MAGKIWAISVRSKVGVSSALASASRLKIYLGHVVSYQFLVAIALSFILIFFLLNF